MVRWLNMLFQAAARRVDMRLKCTIKHVGLEAEFDHLRLWHAREQRRRNRFFSILAGESKTFRPHDEVERE